MRKKKALALILALCLAVSLCPATALAETDLFFTAVNDTLLTYNSSTAPVYYGGTLYLPYTLFTTNGFGIYYSSFSDRNVECLYSGSTTLFFDLDTGYAFNDANDMFDVSAIYYGGLLYVPAYFTCGQFGLGCSVITSAPAPIARVTSGSESYSNSALASAYASRIQAVIDSMTAPDTPPVQPDPEKPEDDDYSDVTLFLGFRGILDGNCREILDVLDDYGVRGCFFVSEDDILGSPDDIRRICGNGHSVGIYLSDGSRDEYAAAAGLLFEAAMTATIIVTSGPETEEAAKEAARQQDLIFRAADDICEEGFTSDSAVSALSKASGSRQLILFECYEGAADELRGFLRYALDAKYTIGRINEVTVYTPDIA